MKKINFYFLCFNICWVLGLLSYQIAIFVQHNHSFVYPLDDTYIHLSIGKNIAEHGIWGVTAHEFSGASSSILYTLVLAISVKVFGSSVLLPLILNIIAFLVLAYSIYAIANKEKWGVLPNVIASLALFFAPLPALIISGMEHVIQLNIFLWLVYYTSLKIKIYLNDNISDAKLNLGWYLLMLLAVCIRFEGLFLLAVIVLLLVYFKQFKQALLLTVAGFLPVVLYGLYSISNGSFFLPNSVLLKGDRPTFSFLGLLQYSHSWLDKLMLTPHLMNLMIGLILIFLTITFARKSDKFKNLFLAIILLTFIIHMVLARVGWFFRYEAYIIFVAFIGIALLTSDLRTVLSTFLKEQYSRFILCVLVVFLLYPLIFRSFESSIYTPVAMQNIHDQQIQMADFLKQYYPNESIAANDIGAISYFTNIHLLDVYGLASKEIMHLRINKMHNKEQIKKLCEAKDVKIAIVYNEWFDGKIPDSWVVCGSLSIENNYICGGDIVHFYANHTENVEYLKKALRQFKVSKEINGISIF